MKPTLHISGNLAYELYYYGHSSDYLKRSAYKLVSYRLTKFFLPTLGVDLFPAIAYIFDTFVNLEQIKNCEGGVVHRNLDIAIQSSALTGEKIFQLVEENFFPNSPYIAHPLQLQRPDRDYLLFVRQVFAPKADLSQKNTADLFKNFDPRRLDPKMDEVFIFPKVS